MSKQTKGFCKYCGKEYTKFGMIKHLAACKEKDKIYRDKKEKTYYYQLLIYGKYNKDYWLIIQIKESATLKDLDQFIRDIWVECCGHLSAFDIYGERYESISTMDAFWGEPAKSMDFKLKNVFEVGMEIEYEYDYGSTTKLIINVKGRYEAPNQKEEIVLLSRNNPQQYICSICGENNASWINPQGYYDGTLFWCDECLKKCVNGEEDSDEWEEEHEFYVDYMSPVCNSPRMGVCAYEGSEIYPDQFEPDKK